MALGGTALVNGALHIPAGAANHRVDAEMTLNRDLLLFSMTPHTHVRGVRWHYEAVFPDGTREAAALGAELRLRVAARVRVRAADRTAGRHDHQGVGVVRQLAGEQVESRCRPRTSGGATRPGKR